MPLYTRQLKGFGTPLSSWDMAILEYLPFAHHGEIRLIDIQPGVFADKLQLRIYHGTLDEADPSQFDALSYVWGSQDDPVMADIDVVSTKHVVASCTLFITQNLATALTHIRYPDRSRTVWADAICINQDDHAERSQQVLMMGDIYRRARQVVAFLGPESNDSSHALSLIQKLSTVIEVDFASSHAKFIPGQSTEPAWSGMNDMQQELPFGERDLFAIYHLVQRKWFERLWIRQEIGLGGARSVLVCGTKEVGWLSFCRAIFIIWRKPVPSNVFGATQLRTWRDRIGKADTVALYSMRAFSFTNLRRQIGRSLCSDERDRIYGVLSQLRETDQIGIIPDYTNTVTKTYLDATQKHIKHFGNLMILSQCELCDSEHKTDWQLPSWVPDWSTPIHFSPIHEATLPLFLLLPAVASMDDKLLRTYGIRCGKVSRVVKAALGESIHDGGDAESARMLQKFLTGVADDTALRSSYRSEDGIIEAYCRTLWVNNFAERWHPPAPHEPRHRDCLSLVRHIVRSGAALADLSSLPNVTQCLDRHRGACWGRALFVAEDGHLGLAPTTVASGDIVCLFFGFPKPIMLRPVPDLTSGPTSKYLVIGECYVHGMMQGEPILGELPEHLGGLLDSDGLMGLRSAGFVDIRSGEIVQEDPRMKPFLAQLVEKGFLHEPTLEGLKKMEVLDLLVRCGISIDVFNLI